MTDSFLIAPGQSQILEYPGYKGVLSRCQITRYGRLVVVSELQDNPGTPVSEAVEIVATRIAEQCSIPPDQLWLVEENSNRNPRWARVTLTLGDTYMHIQRVCFVGSSWSPLTAAELTEMIRIALIQD